MYYSFKLLLSITVLVSNFLKTALNAVCLWCHSHTVVACRLKKDLLPVKGTSQRQQSQQSILHRQNRGWLMSNVGYPGTS